MVVVWAGAHPLPKLMDLKPERYKIEIAPGGNILPVMAGWKQFPGLEGAIYYYWGFPKNPVNDWLVSEYKKKNNGAIIANSTNDCPRIDLRFERPPGLSSWNAVVLPSDGMVKAGFLTCMRCSMKSLLSKCYELQLAAPSY